MASMLRTGVELVEEAAERAAALSPDDAATVADFVRLYYSHVAPEDLAARGSTYLAAAARSHWDLAAERPAGESLVRVSTPTVPGPGHTVVEIVTDDMPFLVDSVTMEIERHDLTIHLLVHPIVTVRRDGPRLVGLAAGAGGGVPEAGATEESFIHVEVDRTTDVDDTAPLVDDIRRVLADVRSATGDWTAMIAAVGRVLGDLEQRPPPVDAEELTETRALLRWMADDHFTFLGFREYDLSGQPGEEGLVARPGTGLGILAADGDAAASTSFGRLPADIRAKAWEPRLLTVTKANSRATVHRATYLDYVGIKRFGDGGVVEGEWRFLGLWTSAAYSAPAGAIPLLRRKIATVVAEAGFAPGSHDEKKLRHVLETYPRDDLFQIDVETLREIAVAVVQLQERKRVKLFTHRDEFRRFVSALVFLPRERYTTQTRLAITELLVRAFGAIGHEFQARVSESPLARLRIVLRTDPADDPSVDLAALEESVAAATRAWTDDLRDALVAAHGEERGVDLYRSWSTAFPPAFQDDHPAAAAVETIAEVTALPTGSALRCVLTPASGDGEGDLDLTLYVRGEPPVLSEVLPILGHMGAEVVDEHPYRVEPLDAAPVVVQRFGLKTLAGTPPGPSVARAFEECFEAVLSGETEDDGLNRLVLLGELAWNDVAVLRAYCRYLRQIGSPFGLGYVFDALAAHPEIARAVFDLFTTRFDPAYPGERAVATRQIEERIRAALDAVASLDEDRILRSVLHLVQATVRTNRFLVPRPPTVAIKFDPTLVPDLPPPHPKHEVWVYAPAVEGVHLRADSVARGGIRWSDRLADFRTEILGLMKAQRVKNTVIVPAGAKGGFVVRSTRPGIAGPTRDDVVAAYRAFVSALLDVVDNRVEGAAVTAAEIVRYDADDVYLVVAADKGTASFSDIANAIALERGYWLGDAFASGGSVGYDHKKMGITAKGAWESVRHHFFELGVDVDRHPFTAVGIGDMSGDVFGNGMLLSRTIRLLGAFDHRHVFLDPDPDPERAFEERRRLFELPASSWDDYDRAAISEGGGVYPRSAKSVPISEPVRVALGLPDDTASLTPAEVVRAILEAPVALLWNGGVGTFVKATHERHADVGDKANDGVRVDASRLRCRVVAEGGNLGLTQAARVEFALHGGLVNADFIDNSAGVDASDHEVNIKILLDTVVSQGGLTHDERNALLLSMTDEVATLVLRNNYLQNRAIANSRAQAMSMGDVHARYIRALEQRGLLDRALEYLPDEEEFQERRAKGSGLAGPELAVLLSYTKIGLEEEIRAADVADDADFDEELVAYFPAELRDRFRPAIELHPLRRGIISMQVANHLANAAGTTFVFRMEEETGASVADIARAHRIAREMFDLDGLCAGVEALDGRVPAQTQTEMYLEARKLVERASRWLLRHRRRPLPVRTTLDFFAPGVRALAERLPSLLGAGEGGAVDRRRAVLVERGVPDQLALALASAEPQLGTLDIVDLALRAGLDVDGVAGVYLLLGEILHLDWMLDRILDLPRGDRWQALARTALRDDCYAVRRELTSDVVAQTAALADASAAVHGWLDANRAVADRALGVIEDLRAQGANDLSTLTVALRELRNLAQPG